MCLLKEMPHESAPGTDGTSSDASPRRLRRHLGERAVTGGGIGAVTGLAIGAVAGWPLPAPVLVGAAVGAGIGAVTTPGKEFKF